MIPDNIIQKAKRMLPIIWREYKLLDENDPVAIKLSNEIDFYEHIKNGIMLCVYTEKEECSQCRYRKYCEEVTNGI